MTDREKKQREVLEELVSHTICNIDVPRSFSDRKNIDQALAKLDAIPTSKEILKKYEELTPQGSEFANDPENVYEYIKERLNSASEAKKEVVRLKRELAKPIPTPKEVDFEQFLSEKHAEQYCGSKSNMVDDCADWITNLSPDEFIEYADLYAKTFQAVKPKEAELNAIPTSKEVEYAIRLTKDLSQLMLQTDWGGVSVTKGAFRRALQTLIQAVKPKEEVGCEEIADKIAKELPVNYDGTNPGNYHILEALAKSLLTNYSIRRRG